MDLPRLADLPALDWERLAATEPLFKAMASCPQDPVHHGEGDVLTHTRMVVEALLADAAWLALDEPEREELAWAALLHDVGKPARTVEVDGRLTAPAHASHGARIAREVLWRAGLHPHRRERVCALVRFHMRPFHALGRADPRRGTIEISLSCRADRLAMLARADTLGRIAPDNDARLEDIELFAAHCEELGCLDGPFAFAGDHSRFAYFRADGRDPAYAAYDDTRSRALVLSALPGAGKDAWLAANEPELPVVSLDALRATAGSPGEVIATARETAREHLRAGRDFAWNATNLSRRLRGQVVDLLAAYRARVEIVCVEASPADIRSRNQSREQAERVPEAALERMLRRWEFPDLTEAHAIHWIV